MKGKTQSAQCIIGAALAAAWFVLPAVPQEGHMENGTASWYGYPYHGRFSASGEVYDMDDLTAAHPTLPFNTLVRVDGRIIDLSRAAARSIGLIEPGTTRVRLEIVGAVDAPSPAIPNSFAAFAVQTGAFRDPANAQRCFALMKSRYGSARLVPPEENAEIWRVLVGAEATREGADILSARIRHDSGENNAFVVRLDSSNEPDRPVQSPRPRGTVAADGLHPPSD